MLNVNDLTTLLAGPSVEVNTGSGSLAQQVKDIIVSAAFSWSNSNSLTLDAYRSIAVDQPVAANGSSGVSLVTDDGGIGGTLSFNSGGSLSFSSPTNSLSINGKSYTLADSIATLAAHIAGDPSGRYALSASYDASQDGTYKNSPIWMKFRGTFNGLGNTISNLTILKTYHGKSHTGLFANVVKRGEVDSLVVRNANIAAPDRIQYTQFSAGIIVALNSGIVFNSFVSGRIGGTARRQHKTLYVGGLAGINIGNIVDSGASATVSVFEAGRSTYTSAGGLVGTNWGTIEQSYATGSVAGYDDSGGFVGYNAGIVENCYATGATTVTSPTSFVGGLIGSSGLSGNSTIEDSYSSGAPTGADTSDVGGFLGFDYKRVGLLTNNYWDTTSSGITDLSQGDGNIPIDPGIKGKSTVQLQSGLPKGFSPKIWA